MGISDRSKMSLVVVSVNLRKFLVFMSKNASFAIKTNSFFMELTAILSLVVIVNSGLHLCNSVTFSKLFFTMSEMAFRSVMAVAVYPHFAHLTFQPLALKGLQEISFRFFLVN